MISGTTVALSGDTLAVASYSEDSCSTGVNGDQTNNSCESAGAVYVFARRNGSWWQQAYLKASNAEILFGESLALEGDTLAVGAGSEASCAKGINGDQINNECPQAGAVYLHTEQIVHGLATSLFEGVEYGIRRLLWHSTVAKPQYASCLRFW